MKYQANRGDASILSYKKKAGVAFAMGDPVVTDATGLLVVAGATATPATLIGIIQRDVVSTDSDYASTSDCMVEIPEQDVEYKAEVGAGVPAQTMVGKRYDLDATGKVNLLAQLIKVVEVTRLAQDSAYVYVRFVNA